MRSSLLVFIFAMGCGPANAASVSISDDIDRTWNKNLLLASSEEEMSSLNEQIFNIRKLLWLCQEEWQKQDLPLGCYQLVHAIKSSTHFRNLPLDEFQSELERQCGVALHHQRNAQHVQIDQLLRYKTVHWPGSGSCHRSIKSHVERLQYMQSTRY